MAQGFDEEHSSFDEAQFDETPPLEKRGCRGCGCLAAVLITIVVVIALLPTLASMPQVHGPLLKAGLDDADFELRVGDVSLGWLSPLVATDVRVTLRGADRPILSIQELSSSGGLLKLLLGNDWGAIRLVQPALDVEVERRPSGFSGILGAEGPRDLITRPLRLEVTEASITVRGRDNPDPWQMTGLQFHVDLIPADASPAGVPTLRGWDTTILNNAELTPEMCDDILKFVAPVLARTTKSSGRVSLVLDEFTWPLGQPAKGELKGKLSLHEVSAGPGAVLQGVIHALGLPVTADAIRLAKDNVVDFSMRDGRIYHENLAFGLADLPGDRLIRTRGSVGLDETLDLFVSIPPLATRLLPEGPLREALTQQRIDLHVTGTFNRPVVKLPSAGAQAGPALRALSDWLQERSPSRDGQPARPLLPNRWRTTQPQRDGD